MKTCRIFVLASRKTTAGRHVQHHPSTTADALAALSAWLAKVALKARRRPSLPGPASSSFHGKSMPATKTQSSSSLPPPPRSSPPPQPWARNRQL
jgi:hypothetical protein